MHYKIQLLSINIPYFNPSNIGKMTKQIQFLQIEIEKTNRYTQIASYYFGQKKKLQEF